MDTQIVWIIEDDHYVCQMVERVLETFGYKSVCMTTYTEAMHNLADLKKVWLVLLDLQLPDGNGRDLLPWLCRPDGPSVAIMTGHGTMEDAVEAMRYGVSDFLTKPFSQSDIRRMLRHVSTRQQLRMGSFAEHLKSIDDRFATQGVAIQDLKTKVEGLEGLMNEFFSKRNHA